MLSTFRTRFTSIGICDSSLFDKFFVIANFFFPEHALPLGKKVGRENHFTIDELWITM